MPIRLNLLAEAQALEDLRRRDPVKRVIWAGVFGVVLVLGWSSSLQLRALLAKGDLNRLDAQVNARTNEYRQVLENQSKLLEVRHKLASLRQLATNRFLQAPILDALQRSVVDHVELTRLRTEQTYVFAPETKRSTNSSNQIIPAKKATVTEKIVIACEAKDSGSSPGDQISKFKQAIATNEYFRTVLDITNEVRLASLSTPQLSPEGKPYVLFTLECRLPEKTR